MFSSANLDKKFKNTEPNGGIAQSLNYDINVSESENLKYFKKLNI